MSSVRNKNDNIHNRVKPEQKQLITEAATLLGLDLSTFMLQQSLKMAREEMTKFQKITPSQHDAELFLKALVNPPAPNDHLKAAYQQYGKAFNSHI